MMRFFSSCLLSLMAIWFSFHDFNICFLVFFFIVVTYFSILIFYYYVSLKYHVFLFIGDLDYIVQKKLWVWVATTLVKTGPDQPWPLLVIKFTLLSVRDIFQLANNLVTTITCVYIFMSAPVRTVPKNFQTNLSTFLLYIFFWLKTLTCKRRRVETPKDYQIYI
jgi:hypothetical protein